jgi:plasmid stabilization system protein ParE
VIESDVAFSPEALDDIRQLYDWLADAAGPVTALRYIERLEV